MRQRRVAYNRSTHRRPDQAHFQRHLLSVLAQSAFPLTHVARGLSFPEDQAGDSDIQTGSENARPRRPTLRSSLVYAANKEIPNRFQLCQTINKAARVLHLPNSPTESTINRVLQDISHPVSELETEKTEAAV
jgi:hypothetical protein